MGTCKSMILQYDTTEVYKVKLLNISDCNNKVYLLLFETYLLIINRDGLELYNIFFNSIDSLLILYLSNVMKIRVNNFDGIIFELHLKIYKNTDDKLNIKSYILSNLLQDDKMIITNEEPHSIKYYITDKN
jgi:hypothetical protein